MAFRGKQALIIAGPGTGKTAVLTARIAGLLEEGVDPSSILALSFTAKAAAELRDRIARSAGVEAAGKITAATFHSLCAAILREHAAEAGLSPDFRILGEAERQDILKELCTLPGTGRIKPRSLGNYIEERKRFLLLPGEDRPLSAFPALEDWADPAEPAANRGLPPVEAGHEALYGRYRQALRAGMSLDFDDLPAGLVRLFAAHRDLCLRYRERFRHIFVDEYQDINFPQYALIRLLAPAAGEGPALSVIGDPNQAIYAFRGSDKGFIDRFLADYPQAALFHLHRSFRCAAPIIGAANRLLDLRLEGRSAAARIFRAEYPTEYAEAEGIARHIARLIGGASFFALDSGTAGDAAEEPCSLEDCAVLLRTASLAPPILKALANHDIPSEYIREAPWWEEEPARSLLDMLRKSPAASASPVNALEAALASMRRNRRAPPGNEAALERLLNLASLYDDLPSFLDILAVSAPGGVPELRVEGVRVMTIHAAKGLEFEHVFVAALEEGLLPFTLFEKKPGTAGEAGTGGPEEERIAEERRLLYVAMTRAKSGLYLSCARSRNYRGRTLRSGPSRFLACLEEDAPLIREPIPRQRESQLRLF